VRASFLVYGVGARFGPACVCERKDRGIYVLKFYMSVNIYCTYVCVPRSCTVQGLGLAPCECAKVRIEVYNCSSSTLVYVYTVNMCAPRS